MTAECVGQMGCEISSVSIHLSHPSTQSSDHLLYSFFEPILNRSAMIMVETVSVCMKFPFH
jgi:hypothetical protein